LRERERLALSIMALIATQHHAHSKAWTTAGLCEALELASSPVERTVSLLVAANYLAETGEEPPRLVLARETSTISLNELLDTVRAWGGVLPVRHARVEALETVDRLVQQLETARHAALSGMSLKDLLQVSME
jgi:membrane protein